MFEEPIRFFIALVQHDGSVLDFLDGDYTLVNPVLAKHYGMPTLTTAPMSGPVSTRRIASTAAGCCHGLFMTKNAGLRTNP